jgi:hypothetical protein
MSSHTDPRERRDSSVGSRPHPGTREAVASRLRYPLSGGTSLRSRERVTALSPFISTRVAHGLRRHLQCAQKRASRQRLPSRTRRSQTRRLQWRHCGRLGWLSIGPQLIRAGSRQRLSAPPWYLHVPSCRAGLIAAERPLSRESGAADWFRGDGLSVPVVAGKQGRRTGCSRRPSPDEAACLAVGEDQESGLAGAKDLLLRQLAQRASPPSRRPI